MSVEHEVAIIYCGVNGLLENVPLDKVAEFEKQFIQLLDAKYKDTVLTPIGQGKLTDDVTSKINEAAAQIAGQF